MDKQSHARSIVGWTYLFFPKRQRLHRLRLGMDKWFHPTLYHGCNHLSVLGFKLNPVSNRTPERRAILLCTQFHLAGIIDSVAISIGLQVFRLNCIFLYALQINWGGWGCEVSCGGHHRPRGKTTTGSALDGAVFDITQILAYLVHNMSRSQLYLGFGHFVWLPSFFGQ